MRDHIACSAYLTTYSARSTEGPMFESVTWGLSTLPFFSFLFFSGLKSLDLKIFYYAHNIILYIG